VGRRGGELEHEAGPERRGGSSSTSIRGDEQSQLEREAAERRDGEHEHPR
jgi:hypothetical protein